MKHLIPSIEQARTACLDFVNLQFDQLLEKVKSSTDFLADMNATNDQEPQGEYVATMIVEAPDETPQIPTDAELEKALEKPEVKELEKRFDLEQTGEEKLNMVDPILWERLVKTFVIAGWNMRKLLDSKWWKEQTITLTKKEAKRLEELSLLRDQMVLKEMDLAQVQAQNGITEIESMAFAELAAKENLK